MLLLSFVFLDLADGLFLSITLGFLHLIFAEDNNLLLLLLLALDRLLECLDMFFDSRIGRLPDFLVLDKTCNLLVIFSESLAALKEKVLSKVNMGLLEKFVSFFRFSCVLLFFVLKVSSLQLSLVINVGFFTLFKFDQFVVEVL